jgi:HrpA-like RNA helicase
VVVGPPLVLLTAVEPPPAKAVAGALEVLKEIDAVMQEEGEDKRILLRPLGYHLASLPVDVRLGKMVR